MPDPDCGFYISWKTETKGFINAAECIHFDDLGLTCQAPKCKYFAKSCIWFDPTWIEYWRVKDGE